MRRLEERELLSPDDFCSKFYPDEDLSKERIKEVLRGLSDALEISAGKLRPGDRFLVELYPPKITSTGLDDTDLSLIVLTKVLEKKYRVQIDRKMIKTIDDYIRAACNLSSDPRMMPIASGPGR